MFRPAPPHDLRVLPDRFRVGGVEVDVPAVRVTRDGSPLALEPRAFDLLLLLAANRGRVVEKDEIHERLWGEVAVTDNALTRVVAHLRRDLGDDAGEARYIETVRTRGYRFLPELEPVASTLPAPAAPTPHVVLPGPSPVSSVPAAPALAPPRPGRRIPPWAVAGGLVAAAVAVAAVVVAVGRLAPRDRRSAATDASPRPGVPLQLTFSPGYDGDPSFSPDGQAIAYTSERDGMLDIVIRSIAEGSELQLTHGGGNVDPAYSPDGRWIAFHSRKRGGLWLVSSLGGEPRQLTEHGSQPTWSPDGSEIAFRTHETEALGSEGWPGPHGSVLAVVGVESGQVRRLTTPDRPPGGHGSPAWMPDGQAIAFAAGDANHSGIYIVRADGKAVSTVVESSVEAMQNPDYWRGSAPLPDGTAILAARLGKGASIERLSLAAGGQPPEPVVPLAPLLTFGLAVSPDGHRLAYAVPSPMSRIDAVSIDAQANRIGPPRTLSDESTLRLMMPSYSPDGRHLVYARRHPGAWVDHIAVDPATLERRELGVGVVEAGWWSWSWTSPTELLFDALGRGLRLDLATGRRREVGGLSGWAPVAERHDVLANSVRLSPDGSRLLFAARAGAAQEIFVWRVGAGDATQVTHWGRIADFPFWAPDGSRIAAQVMDAGATRTEIWLLGADGADPQRLPTGAGLSWGTAFSPTGALVAYAALRGGRWDIAVAAPGVPERLLGIEAPETGYLRWPAWSPNGREIAYEYTATRADIWLLSLDAGR